MNTELIEHYLLNEMSAADKAAFELRLASEPALREELETQKALMQAIERTAMKTQIQKSIKRHVMKKNIIKWGAGVIITAAIVTISFFVYKNTRTNEVNLRYDTNEMGTQEFADADKYLASQLFNINNNEDTIIETRDGIVFAIPAHAFKNADGSDVSGKIDIEIKEAINTKDIIKAGLSTMSNDELLETGGMFYFNARSGDNNLSIVKEINAGVPTNEIKPEMKLFEGKRMADGSINWVNPVELDKDLTTYNITDLDFYPPNYIPKLQELGMDWKNKKFTDSLYYSFTGYSGRSDLLHYRSPDSYSMVEEDLQTGKVISYDNNLKPSLFFNNRSEYLQYRDSLDKLRMPAKMDSAVVSSDAYDYEIEPSRIKTIWNEKFNNTILATKEFEERLKYIHSNCWFLETRNIDAFTVYVNNIDKPLYYSDSILSTQLNIYSKYYRFEEFYKRHEGGVKVSSSLQQKLSEYYIKRSTLLKEIGGKTWQKMYEDEAKKDATAEKNKNTHDYIDEIRNSKMFKEELEKNMKEAYGQLDYKKTYSTLPPNTYNVIINSPGWKNLDQYVYESTASRATLNYTDPLTGKKAIIKYQPFSVTVNGTFDRTLVYLVPQELSSFQRVRQEGNVFKENLNEFIRYDLLVIAYKGNDIYYHLENKISPQSYTCDLEKITPEELDKKFRKLSKEKRNDLNTEIEYQVFAQKEAERKRVQLAVEKQREVIAKSIFPCLNQTDSIQNASPPMQ